MAYEDADGLPRELAESTSATGLLRVEDLSFRYGPRTPWLFRDLSFTVESGEILSVLAPNARGKTTLLKNLAGLLRPKTGRVLTKAPISYVPQEHGADNGFLVSDMVLMGRTRSLGMFRVPGKTDRSAAMEAMHQVGVAAHADRTYAELSGGQRQLVLIARAVASDAQILVLDEPTSALDLRNQSRVLHVLRELAAAGLAVIMTTHHPDHALHASRNTLLLVDGHETRWGPTESLLTDEVLSNVYGLPISVPTVWTGSGPRLIAVPDFGSPSLPTEVARDKQRSALHPSKEYA